MKGFLLDTHVFLWVVMSPERLSSTVRRTFESLDVNLFVSAASVWEIAQKRAAKKLEFHGEIVRTMERHTLRELPVRGVHCELAATLPRYHKDPFDRLLIAQAKIEELILMTRDEVIAAYDVALMRV